MDRTPASEILWQNLLRQRKAPLLDAWYCRILDAYPAETASFLKKQADRFSNPVAHALWESAEAIFKALLDGAEADAEALGYAMKIRALQGNDPREGISFIYLLKDTLTESLGGSLSEMDWIEIGSRLDRIAAAGREMFLADRAKIAELAARTAPSADGAGAPSAQKQSFEVL